MTNTAPNSNPQRRPQSDTSPHTTAFYLGQFFGHIVQAIKSDVTPPVANTSTTPPQPIAPNATTVQTRIAEAVVETPNGPVTLRRTTIDEVDAG